MTNQTDSLVKPLGWGLLPVSLTILLLISYFFRDDWLALAVELFPDRIEGIYLVNKLHVAAILILGCWSLLVLLDRYVWRGAFYQRTGRAVPRLLTDLVTTIFVTLTVMALLVVVLDQSVTTVSLTIGGFFLLVIVFFREMFQDMLAGISINLDPAIKLGDVIELPTGVIGRLEQVSWRTTTLVADNHSQVLVPNRVIATSTLINFSGDRTARQLEASMVMDFSISVERVVRIFDGALSALAAQEKILSAPAPSAFASSPTTYGNEFVVRFYFDSNTMQEPEVRTAVVAELMRHLQSSGLNPSLPKQNVFLGEARMKNMEWLNPVHRETLIAGFSIFGGLEQNELAELASSVILHDLSKGTQVIRQGEEGTSMFGLAEGYLEVEVSMDTLEKIKVGDLVPGQFFGEMSMLVGEPRAATVTAVADSVAFEITREAFNRIVEQRPETAVKISRIIAERQLMNSQKLEASAAEKEAAIGQAADTLFARMKAVFSSLTQTSAQ